MFCRTCKIKSEPCTFNQVFDLGKRVNGKRSEKKKEVILNFLVEKKKQYIYIYIYIIYNNQ